MKITAKPLLVLVFAILISTNLLQAYYLFDNALLINDMQTGINYLKNDRRDALLIINELIAKSSQEEVRMLITKLAQENKDSLLFQEEDGEFSLNEIVFKRAYTRMRAEYMNP